MKTLTPRIFDFVKSKQEMIYLIQYAEIHNEVTMKIYVTDGTGYAGKHIINKLITLNYQALVLSLVRKSEVANNALKQPVIGRLGLILYEYKIRNNT